VFFPSGIATLGRALRQAQYKRGLCLGAEKLEARKMLKNPARRKAAVPSVQQPAPHTKCDGAHALLGCFGYGNTSSIALYCTLPPQTLQYISFQPGWLEGKLGRITRMILECKSIIQTNKHRSTYFVCWGNLS
jgi:hypothetical protein